jgi:hypothetical protein
MCCGCRASAGSRPRCGTLRSVEGQVWHLLHRNGGKSHGARVHAHKFVLASRPEPAVTTHVLFLAMACSLASPLDPHWSLLSCTHPFFSCLPCACLPPALNNSLAGYLLQEKSRLATFTASVQRAVAVNSNPQMTYWLGLNAFSAIPWDEFKSTYLSPVDMPSAESITEPAQPATALADGSTGDGLNSLSPNLPAGRRLQGMGTPTSKGRRLHQYIPSPACSTSSDVFSIVDFRSITETYSWGSVVNNYVTPPKDQGVCGAGWAFAAVGALESLMLSQNRKPYKDWNLDLSEQQVVRTSLAPS